MAERRSNSLERRETAALAAVGNKYPGVSRRDFLKLGGAGFAGVTLLGVPGCGLFGPAQSEGGSQGPGNTLRTYFGAEISTLDVTDVFDITSFEAIYNLNSGLYRLDQSGEPQPEIAESVDISDDETTYTFTLREGVQWSNGDPLTSEDFRYAWLRAMNPETAGTYSTLFTNYIEGGAQFLEGDAGEEQVGIEAPEDRTFRVTLTNPTPFFLELTGHPSFVPLKQSFVEEQGDDYAQNADALLYSGPYRLTQYDPAQGMQMEKNERYWDSDNVSIENVDYRVVTESETRLNLYQSNELDLVSLTAEQADRFRGQEEYHEYFLFQTNWLMTNAEDEVASNANIRQMLQTGFDKQSLVENFLNNGSTAARGVVPLQASGPNDQTFREEFAEPAAEFDPQAARESWNAAVDELGEDTTLTLLIAENSTARDVATFIQEQLQENAGANIEIEVVPFDARLERVNNGDFQVSYTGFGYDYDDPTNWLRVFYSGSSWTSGGFQSDNYDQLYEQAEQERDEGRRMQLLADAERVLLEEEAHLTPLYYVGTAELRKPALQNEKRSAQSTVEFKEWTIDR